MRQHIHIATTADGVRLGWARVGTGPVLVKTANWLTHLRYDLESPVWRHWITFLGGHFDFLRYDERGCGMSDRIVERVSPDAWLLDLECVVDAARIAQPMVLLGISQGAIAVIQFAILHPERVSHLVLYGGYTEGWARREGGDTAPFAIGVQRAGNLLAALCRSLADIAGLQLRSAPMRLAFEPIDSS